MAKKNKAEDAVSAKAPPDICVYPAAATYFSWVNKTDESAAQKMVNDLAKFPQPGRGKHAFDRCESAAERLFLLGGMLKNDRGVELYFAPQERIEKYALCGQWLVGTLKSEDDSEEEFEVLQQYEIEDYRVDFCVPDVNLVIEIDGFEFHGTKEQFIADKKRDRALIAQGYRVVRFSGSEIYSSPNACIVELFELCQSMTPEDDMAMAAHQRSWSAGSEAGYKRCLQEFESATAPMVPQLPSTSTAAEAAE